MRGLYNSKNIIAALYQQAGTFLQDIAKGLQVLQWRPIKEGNREVKWCSKDMFWVQLATNPNLGFVAN